MRISFVTLFPELIKSYFVHGLVGQAASQSQFAFAVVNPRDFATDKHKTVDDTPYGGGDGMIMLYEPLKRAVESVSPQSNPRVIYLTPQGETWNDKLARNWAAEDGDLIFVCGRYGGVDQRFINSHVTDEISVGDFILNGGELAALAVTESILRFTPNFLGNPDSQNSDSFAHGYLEGPSFTKPQVLQVTGEELTVPEILLSGNHRKIAEWRKSLSFLLTVSRRPDLIDQLAVSKSELQRLYIEWQLQTPKEDQAACGWKVHDDDRVKLYLGSES